MVREGSRISSIVKRFFQKRDSANTRGFFSAALKNDLCGKGGEDGRRDIGREERERYKKRKKERVSE